MEQEEKKEQNTNRIKKLLILFFSLIGFITTIKLMIIYVDSNFNPYSLPSFCSINEFIDCDGVAQTTHSQFLGIPLAMWGMGLYIFMVFLLFVDKLKKIKLLSFLEVFKNPLAYISALGLVSFFISMILAIVSIYEIKKVCILCVFTYLLNLLIAVTATDFKAGIFESFKLSVIDFIDALKIKKYLVSFIALVVLASSFLAYTATSYCFAPQVKRYKSIKAFADMKTNPFKASGNILGDKDAPLVVEIYTDYRCPICYTDNLMIHRIAKELAGVKIIHRNLPLDMECNKNLKFPLHEGACMMAKYSIAAEKQDRLWDLNSELFEKQPKDEAAVIKLAKSMGFNINKLRDDANSFETSEKLNGEINKASELGIIGTPTMIINGKIITGIKPYYELKDMLIKAGAVERK